MIQEQLRVLIEGHARWRESHPICDAGDVQVAQTDPEMVLAIDAAGFRTDLLANAQQGRVFWKIVPTKEEWLFLDKCQLVDPKWGRFDLILSLRHCSVSCFADLHVPELGWETQEVTLGSWNWSWNRNRNVRLRANPLTPSCWRHGCWVVLGEFVNDRLSRWLCCGLFGEGVDEKW